MTVPIDCRNKAALTLSHVCLGLLIALLAVAPLSAELQKPHIVLIMCDDMGFSDLGCYDGEIKTPHIDALAAGGVRFTRFMNTSRCCPSRAALLTGRHQHAVEMGWMTAVDEHRSGYRGQLSAAIPTLAEILKAGGYATYLSGKWHLSVDGNIHDQKAGPNGSWPVDRGFDESYGSLAGGGDYWRPTPLIRNEKRLTGYPDDYYYTTAITKHALEFIEGHDRDKPMFLYLAHYAPHRPLQAPQDRIEACKPQYKAGYDVLRKARFERLQKLGIIDAKLEYSVHQKEYGGKRPSWESLSKKQQADWIKEMATYAAMTEIMDEGIGEVVSALKRKGMFDNTVIFFLSDNGATNEGGLISKLAADLSNTPYRSYKSTTYHGGISSPLVVQYPKLLNKHAGEKRHVHSHIIDLLPTCLELAGLEYPSTFRGQPIPQPDGVSLVSAFDGTDLPERALFFEHQSSCAIVSGDWKLVRHGANADWQLFDLRRDPFELTDVAGQHPQIAAKLVTKWDAWAEANQVLPLEHRPWTRRIRHYKKLNPDQDGVDDQHHNSTPVD